MFEDFSSSKYGSDSPSWATIPLTHVIVWFDHIYILEFVVSCKQDKIKESSLVK